MQVVLFYAYFIYKIHKIDLKKKKCCVNCYSVIMLIGENMLLYRWLLLLHFFSELLFEKLQPSRQGIACIWIQEKCRQVSCTVTAN